MLPRLLKKKSSMPLATATAMSVAAGYLVATVGPKLMAKVLPAVPGAGTAGFGQDPAIAAAIQRGIEEGVRDEGLGYTEEEVVGVETLGYTEEEVVGVERDPRLHTGRGQVGSPTGRVRPRDEGKVLASG